MVRLTSAPSRGACTALLALLAAAAQAAPAYLIRVAPDLRSLDVEACFDELPQTLQSGDRAARRYLRAPRQDGADAPRVRGTQMRLHPASGPACLRYAVDIGAAADARALRRSGWHGAAIVVTPELWLWAPDGPFDIDFDLADGHAVSAPWPPHEGSARRFRAGATPVSWAAQVAIGDLHTRELALAGGRLRLAIAQSERLDDPLAVEAWIGHAARALTTVYGRLPRGDTQVLVLPVEHAGSAVPWGQVLRGGAPAVHFLVDRDADGAALGADWTAFHEFAHLVLPFVRRADAFASEGFASYFQNITRGRSGNLTASAAWTELVRGFERGRDAARGATLAQASREMGRSRNYMRVYWSGAALALLGDVQLRAAGRPGLDELLARLAGCCLDGARAWSADELFERLDALAGDDVFLPLWREHRDARGFPEVRPVLASLGIDERDGRTRLDEEAPLAHVRRAIEQPAPVLAPARGCGALSAAAPASTFVLLDPGTGQWQACNVARARQPFLPASTFKVPHALIALATQAVGDPDAAFAWDGRERRVGVWNRDTSLADGLRNSTVWVYQATAARIGHARMDAWVRRLDYGNGTIGPAPALRHFWLDGALRISALEQVRFLDRLRREALPAPVAAQRQVARMMRIDTDAAGRSLHAKSGAALPLDPDSGDLSDAPEVRARVAPAQRIGWYVGWVARPAALGGDRVFALNLDLETDDALRQRARLTRALLAANGVALGEDPATRP